MKRVETLLWAAFPPPTVQLLRRLGEIGVSSGVGVYLVGGVVRDMLLNRPVKDIDIMLEGEALSMVEMLKENWASYFPASALPTKLITFPHYQTAKLRFGGEIAPGISGLDFSRARRESYPLPGGKPIISPGTLYDDLLRRDFSINALAISLVPAKYGELVDFFDGIRALREKTLAALHDQSFRDDPVRLIRGVRFNSRFGFSFDARTQPLVEEATQQKFLTSLNSGRLFEEFMKALSEDEPETIVRNLEHANLLSQIHPELHPSPRLAEANKLLTMVKSVDRQADLYFALMLSDRTEAQFIEVLNYFRLSAKKIEQLLKLRSELSVSYVL